MKASIPQARVIRLPPGKLENGSSGRQRLLVRRRLRCGERDHGFKINKIIARRLSYVWLCITSTAPSTQDNLPRTLEQHEITDNMEPAEQHKLSPEQIDHFIKHGWVKLSNCFTKEQADGLQKNLWTRLGMDPNDRSTWLVSSTPQT
jgi:hypothetical protein